MASGGARARSGPPADLNSYRQRRNEDGWIKLPEHVDRRRTPNWPLKPEPSKRERELWRQFWRMGQSIVWESQHQQLPLAIYVRLLVGIENELFEVPASRITQSRIMAEDLGITITGMTRHKWRYASTEELQAKSEEAMPHPRTPARKSTAQQIAELFPTPEDGDGAG